MAKELIEKWAEEHITQPIRVEDNIIFTSEFQKNDFKAGVEKALSYVMERVENGHKLMTTRHVPDKKDGKMVSVYWVNIEDLKSIIQEVI